MARKVRDVFPFGMLTNTEGDLWERETVLPLFGKSYPARIQVMIDPDSGISDHQVEAFRHFNHECLTGLASCEVAIKRYCANLANNLDGGQRVVDINPPSEHVRPVAVLFDYLFGSVCFGILCDCDWDWDNGVAIKFENGEVTEIGTQNLIL